MNLSTVLRIIVSCLLNAVVAWTVDYYATSLLSRRDVFKTGRKPKIFTVQWLAFTLMLCGFALLPSGLNEVGKFSVICGKVVCYIVLFELLYEGSFLKKLLMAVGHSVIMLGGEFIMYRAFNCSGLESVGVSPCSRFGSACCFRVHFHAGCCSGACNAPRSEHVVRKHHGCSETEAFSSADFVCGADDTVPVDRIQNRSSREHGFGIADTVRAAYDTEHRFSVPPPFEYFRCTKTNGGQ